MRRVGSEKGKKEAAGKPGRRGRAEKDKVNKGIKNPPAHGIMCRGRRILF
jgi:hypothetical protein